MGCVVVGECLHYNVGYSTAIIRIPAPNPSLTAYLLSYVYSLQMSTPLTLSALGTGSRFGPRRPPPSTRALKAPLCGGAPGLARGYPRSAATVMISMLPYILVDTIDIEIGIGFPTNHVVRIISFELSQACAVSGTVRFVSFELSQACAVSGTPGYKERADRFLACQR